METIHLFNLPLIASLIQTHKETFRQARPETTVMVNDFLRQYEEKGWSEDLRPLINKLLEEFFIKGVNHYITGLLLGFPLDGVKVYQESGNPVPGNVLQQYLEEHNFNSQTQEVIIAMRKFWMPAFVSIQFELAVLAQWESGARSYEALRQNLARRSELRLVTTNFASENIKQIGDRMTANNAVVLIDGATNYGRVKERAEELAVLAANNPQRSIVVYNAGRVIEIKGENIVELLKSFDLANIKFVSGPLSDALKPYRFRLGVDLVHYSINEDEDLFAATSMPRWLANRLVRFVGEPGALGYGLKHLQAVKLNKPVEDIQSKDGYHLVSPRASESMRLLQEAQFVTVFAQAA